MSLQDAPLDPHADSGPVSVTVVAVGLTLLTIAAYAALSLAGFVWDDDTLVLRNTLTGDWRNVPQMFTVDLWAAADPPMSTGYFRPLMLVSLAIDRALWGLSPVGHHLHSLVWHLIAAAGLWALLRRIVPPWPAVAGAALFLLHPLQSEAVAWIAARNDLMVAAFTFWSVSLLWDKRPSRGALFSGGLLAAAAMLSKESGLLIGGLLLVLDLARWGRPRGWGRYAVVAVGIVGWLILRDRAGIELVTTTHEAHWEIMLAKAHQLAAHYALRVLVPWPLTTGDHMDYLEFSASELLMGLGGGVAAVTILLTRGGRLAAAGLAFALLSFAPCLVAIAMHGLIGERYLYAPMGGLSLAFAAATAGLPRRFFVVLAPLALGAALVISQRLPAWASELDLWEAAYTQRPNPMNAGGYGNALMYRGELERACPLLMGSLNAALPSLSACTPALRCLTKAGAVEDAARLADELGPRGCELDGALQALRALVYARAGRWEEARALAASPEVASVSEAIVVRGALARQDGDEAAYAAVRAEVPSAGGAALDAVVMALLQGSPSPTPPP